MSADETPAELENEYELPTWQIILGAGGDVSEFERIRERLKWGPNQG